MEGHGRDIPGHQAHLPEEDSKRPGNTVRANQHFTTPSGSPQTIYQGNPPLSLLLSPPQTSPLIPLDAMDSSPPASHLHQYIPSYQGRARVISGHGSYPVYDPSRGEQLRSAADRANPYRDRLERVDHTRGQYRARSRSPRRSIQPAGVHGSREVPRIPFAEFNQYPREMYIPPGMNDQMPHDLPSSSPTLPPKHAQSRGYASGNLGDSPGHTYPPNDGNMYGYPLDQQQLQGCDPGPKTQPANKKEDTSKNDEDHLCEFAAPCRMHPSPDGMHYRKVVSHVFGRNKAVTKLFPLGVWVHYCRKHYQRARYRADQWPFTQCDLLLESLNRMENWDGVESFELILRRREQMRVGRETESAPNSGTSNQNKITPSQNQDQDNKSSGTISRPPGRKHPTAIIAPVPDWLRQHVGHGKTFHEIRRIIELVRNHMVRLRNQERAQQQLNHLPKSPSAPGSPRRGGLSNGRRGRITKPAHRDPLRVRASAVRFPDVEILPHFKPWVKEAALRQRSATNGPTDVKEYEAERRISGGGHILGEIQDTCDINARAESSQPTNGDFVTNNTTPRLDGRSESLSTIEMTGANLSQMQPHIGRAGTNRGQSESQRRRSERVYIKALDRVPTKKPAKDGEPGKDGDR